MGWTAIKNGELLALASEQFDVFVTVDRNLSFQQNLTSFSIVVVVLEGKTNRLTDLRALIPNMLEVIEDMLPGTSSSLVPSEVAVGSRARTVRTKAAQVLPAVIVKDPDAVARAVKGRKIGGVALLNRYVYLLAASSRPANRRDRRHDSQ